MSTEHHQVVKKGSSSFFTQFVEEEQEIQTAMQEHKDSNNLSEIIQSVRQSFQQAHTNSTSTTIFALVNSVVGSIVLLIPINFGKAGIVLSTVIMTIVGILQYFTCRWIVKNTLHNENDIKDVLKRILGQKWADIYNVSSATLLFTVTIIYFQLTTQTCWSILKFIFLRSNYTGFADQNEVVFDNFSIQWTCLILMGLMAPLLFLKKLTFIVKLAGSGIVALYGYLIFISYIFIQNITDDNLSHDSIEKNLVIWKFDIKDVGTVIGNFSIAFASHNLVVNIMSKTRKKEKSSIIIFLAYLFIYLVYAYIGIIGYFALIGRTPYDTNPSLIYGYFNPKDIVSLIVELIFLTHLISVFPLLAFISKTQYFGVLFKDQVLPQKVQIISNILIIASCLIIQVFLIDIDTVIGIAGNVIGYIVIYLVPTRLKYQVEKEKYYEMHKSISVDNQDNKVQQEASKKIMAPSINYDDDEEESNTLEQSLTFMKEQQSIHNHMEQRIKYKYYLICATLVIFNIIGLIFAVISIANIFIE